MSYEWETKFEPGDKVKTSNGSIGKITQVHIMYPSGEDMDHWRKTLPKIGYEKYQYTSYSMEFEDQSDGENPEHALTLIT